MAHFLKGKFKGFYAAGNSQCVKDVFRFRKASEGKIYMEVTRRDMESLFGRFWRYESSTINLMPINEEQPRLGGKVHVKSFVFDFRTFTPQVLNQYGVYNDDFVTFGTFSKETASPLEDESVLLALVEDSNGHHGAVVDKTTFKFDNNNLVFVREVNKENADADTNHAISETKLDVFLTHSWTESLFYGVGNTAKQNKAI